MDNISNPRPLSFLLQTLLVSFLTLHLPSPCLAQDSTSSSADAVATADARRPDSTTSISLQPSSTSSAAAQTHTIQVGLADHKFRPDVTEAEVGDTIEFHFYPSNHSIVRAEYGFPCIPYEMTGSNKQGFFSGFNAVDKVLDNPPKYSIKINDTSPVFFYCSAPGSCLTYSMVGAINPNSSTPITTQQQLARDSAYMLNPGEPFPAEAPLPSGLAGPSGVPTTTPDLHHGLAPGATAGIAVAAISVVILGALLFFFWGRTKALNDEIERKESSVTRRMSLRGGSGGGAANMVQSMQSTPLSTHANANATAGFVMYDQRYTTTDYKPTSPQTQNHPAFSSMYVDQGRNEQNALFELAQGGESAYFHASNQQQRTVSPQANAAPPYGWHVNSSGGPAEMEATSMRGGQEDAEGKSEKEKKSVGEKERARWKEVGARRAGEQSRVF